MGQLVLDEKGAVASYCGLPIAIEAKAGSYRIKAGKDPILVSDSYGEIIGTKGADGDAIDCYVGAYPETDTVYVINQGKQDVFDEHKVMFGFLDQNHAVNVYRLGCYGQSPLSVVSCTMAQFKWWLEYGNHKAELTPQSLPFDTYSEVAMQQIPDYDWNNASAAASRALYDMRVMDSAYGQLNEANDFGTLLDDVGVLAVFDALVIPNNQIQKKANQIGLAFNRYANGELKVVAEGGVEVTEPYRQNGTTNIAMLFTLTDGQTVSVFLHNPDATPGKLAPDDNMVSWKWLLNKKDITIVVAKENGQDQSINAIAKKVMALAEANAAKFARTNAKAAENEAEIKATEERIEQKKNVLQDLLDQIAALESANANPSSPTELDNSNNSVPDITELDESKLQPLEMPTGENIVTADVKKALDKWLSQLQGKSIKTVDNKTVRFSRKSKKHFISDSVYSKLFIPEAVTKIVEVFTSGEFIERQPLNKERNKDAFTAFHVYRKWIDVDNKQVHLQVKAGELDSGILESDIGLVAYSAKDIEKEPPRSATSNTASDVPFEQAGSLINDSAILDSVQEDEIYFIEILEVRDLKEEVISSTNPDAPITTPPNKWYMDPKYTAVYFVGRSRGRENLTIQKTDTHEFDAFLTLGSLGGQFVTNDISELKKWLTGRLQKLSDAVQGDGTPWEAVYERLRLVSGTDVFMQEQEGSEPEVITTEPVSNANEDGENHDDGTQMDKDFLNSVIAGNEDVMADDFYDRMMVVAEKYQEGHENVAMVELVVQAVNAYTAKLDELSK